MFPPIPEQRVSAFAGAPIWRASSPAGSPWRSEMEWTIQQWVSFAEPVGFGVIGPASAAARSDGLGHQLERVRRGCGSSSLFVN